MNIFLKIDDLNTDDEKIDDLNTDGEEIDDLNTEGEKIDDLNTEGENVDDGNPYGENSENLYKFYFCNNDSFPNSDDEYGDEFSSFSFVIGKSDKSLIDASHLSLYINLICDNSNEANGSMTKKLTCILFIKQSILTFIFVKKSNDIFAINGIVLQLISILKIEVIKIFAKK